MIEFVTNIKDFWSTDLEKFVYPVMSPLNTNVRDYWNHPNFQNAKPLLQAFDNDLPEYWNKFLIELGTTEGTVSWTNLVPGQVLPVHTDEFYKLRTKYNVDIEKCRRYLIFLNDWVLGHSVDFEEKTITRWKCGDVWLFDHRSFHCAANASTVDFITCQVNTITI